ncbi:MAG: transposase, partial [Gammaproteobacteria bacterium]|nr:transposase [Gammaproteobacteria bacterium]
MAWACFWGIFHVCLPTLTKSRSSAGSRTIKGLLSEEGIVVGRFKVRRLMSELGLICKQPGPHA